MKIEFQLLIFFIANLACSAIGVLSLAAGFELGPIPLMLFPIIYGAAIGGLILDSSEKKLMYTFLISIFFLAIFVISSFGMLFISNKLFGTDDILPFLSTPLSVFLILFLLSKFIKINNIFILGFIMVVMGIIATYIGNHYSKYESNFIIEIFVNIPFLWQVFTGIPLIWIINNSRTDKTLTKVNIN